MSQLWNEQVPNSRELSCCGVALPAWGICSSGTQVLSSQVSLSLLGINKSSGTAEGSVTLRWQQLPVKKVSLGIFRVFCALAGWNLDKNGVNFPLVLLVHGWCQVMSRTLWLPHIPSLLGAAHNQHFNVFLKVTNLLLTAPKYNIQQAHWQCSWVYSFI